MRRTMRLIVLLLASLASYVDAGELRTATLLNTGPIPCTGVLSTNWQNTLGQPIYVRRVYIWHGLTPGLGADLNTVVIRTGDNMLVAAFPHDRYADPSGPTEQTTDFGAHHMLLTAGAWVTIYYTCAPVGTPPQQHHYVTIGYTVDPL